MITYLLKSGLLLFIFFAVYKLWLENEKMFRFNRAYLLLSILFSLIIPLQLFSIQTFFSTTIHTVQLDEIAIRTSKVLNTNKENYILPWVLAGLYFIVVLILSIRFGLNVFSFYKKIKHNSQLINNEKVVLIQKPILPHSFWNTIFINKEEFENGKIPSEVFVHEKAHLQQKHTLDILFIEVLQILLWFNPLIILYKKAIKLNHEFLADEAVNNQFKSVSEYQKLLLNFVSNNKNIALASTINYSVTKKRLLMMTKKESTIKIILKVFTVGVVYSLTLFVFSNKTNAQEINSNGPKINYSARQVNLEIKKPEFPGGMEEFYKFVGQRFKISEEASKNKVEAKIFTQFMIEKDGSLSEFKIVKDAGYGLGDEAIRVLKLSPKWIPGSENGKPVRILYSLPITIQSVN